MMWSNLSAIAEKAREAAAIIDQQMNDAMAGGDDNENSQEREWETCDGEDPHPQKNESQQQSIQRSPNSGMSFVDLKTADIPKDGTSYVDLKDAAGAASKDNEKSSSIDSQNNVLLARIESLEKTVNSLKDELTSTREEAQNYHAMNLLLEQQVKELKEENASLQAEQKKSDEE